MKYNTVAKIIKKIIYFIAIPEHILVYHVLKRWKL